ncbi:MAG: gamma-glutamylcyclotransferase [Gammaproteobacteria bacterium]
MTDSGHFRAHNVVLPPGDLWVFGYGSLMWNPGFVFAETHIARLFGYHRALCVWSWVYRGTRDQPGLVLGLDTGGSCKGRAFRVRERDRSAVLAYLYEREMIAYAYTPCVRPVRFGRRCAQALTFVVDRAHRQYAGKLSAQDTARIIRAAAGDKGDNLEYLLNTAKHLRELGIRDKALCDLMRVLE